MNTLLQWGGHPAVDRLGWTLLHFLWQGAVIAALFAVAQTGLRRRSSHARYWTGCLALGLMLAAPVTTFIALGAERTIPVALAAGGTRSSAARPPALDGQGGQSGQPGHPRSPVPLPAYLNPNLNLNLPAPPSLLSGKLIPGLVLVWLLGVSALSIRLLFSSLHVARLKRRGHEPPGEPWLERLDRLRAALQISRPVRLVKSVLIEVPAVVGWLRPVILLPAASLAGLTPEQLEAILAHELAHVRRHDYLVNLLQNALETLLFYHPAVWWISSCVRAEREICCDEIAVKLCGDRLVYAQALAALEQLRAGGSSLALGADGGSLLERIRRLSGAPAGGSFPRRRHAGGALVAALVAGILVSLLHHPSNNAKAQGTRPAAPNQTNTAAGPVNSSKPGANPSGLSLVIRCTNEVLKVGDEIPIEFIISNHSAEDFSYLDPMPQLMVPDEVNLVAKTTTGESVPSPSLPSRSTQLARQILVLHPGQSFSKIIPLNFWALIKEPGQYQVLGAYLGRNHLFSPGPHNQRIALVNSAPITITVQPRSKKEMDDYIGDLTNQVAARLAIKAAQAQFDDSVLDELLLKLMYTCNPKIIPTLLRIMDEAGPHSGDWGWFGREALLCYVPKTEESWQSILQEASRHALTWHMEELLAEYNFNGAEMKPIIERALAPDKMDEWRFGAMLAASSFYDDAFTPRLIAIATDSNAPRKYTGRIIGEELSWNTVRGAAMAALAMNRTDEGVKALRSLLNDPDPQLCVLLAQAILGGYDSRLNMPSSPTGRHLLPGDFDAQEVRPLIERMLASASSSYKVEGLRLVERFGDDAWTPQLVSLAMKPGDIGTRYSAIQALAMNRTDEGVKTLKTLLHDPDAAISQIVEWSIRAAYTAHGDALGRPLRADDFDAKYQVPEGAPPTNPASTNNGGAIPSSESNRAEDGLKKLAPSNTGEPQVVKLIQLAHSDPTNIVAEVSKALTNTVTIIPDFRTHQVIVRATEREMPAAEELIRQLDSATNRFPTNPPPAAPNQTNAPPGPVNSSKPAANPSGLSLEIRCTNEVLKVGDEIPIEFIISNHGTEEYMYADTTIYSTRLDGQFKLIAKTASGATVPGARDHISEGVSVGVAISGVLHSLQSAPPEAFDLRRIEVGVVLPSVESAPPERGTLWFIGADNVVLHPGESFSKIIPLNRWALIREPGRYVVAGNYQPTYTTNPMAPISADPITITVLPRTKEEMAGYIQGLTNQVAAQLAAKAGRPAGAPDFLDPVLVGLLSKLMDTCNPEIVPTLLTIASQAGGEGEWANEALLHYMPQTEEIWQAILQTAVKHRLNPNLEYLLLDYDSRNKEMKPVIARSLALQNPDEWQAGAALAAHYRDDAFTARLLAIAVDPNASLETRVAAIEALAANHTDPGAKTFKALLTNPSPEISEALIAAIEISYNNSYSGLTSPTGKRLQLDAKDLTPLIERLLASKKPADIIKGVSLADASGDEEVTAKLVALATNPRSIDREGAIHALSLNRTDEGVKALKTLLNDPDPDLWAPLADAIGQGYDSWPEARRHLRTEDFGAKDMRPLMERLLASNRESDLLRGVRLAARSGGDASTPKLVELAADPGFPFRDAAIHALAFNRTDEAVRELKTLLIDHDPQISKCAEEAIRAAYTARGDALGRPLRADDFDAKLQQPKARPATNPASTNKDDAIPSSESNRAEDGLKKLAPSNTVEPQVVKLIQLAHSDPTNIVAEVSKAWTNTVTIIPDFRTHQVIVRATEREMPGVEELIRQLDSATNRFPTNPPPAAPNQTNAPPGPVNSSKPAANPSGLSLEIRCTNEVLKVGDEIPIEFILSNHGTEDYKYIDHTYWRSDRWDEYKLTAKTASGEAVPCQSENYKAANWSGALEFRVLHPGESFSKIFALNCWALIMEPGRYEVSGSYLGIPSADPKIATANSAPIRLAILPRTKEEMHDYVKGLTNQIAARLPIKQDKSGMRYDLVLNDLLEKLMYTCSPEMIPTQIGIMYEPGPRGNHTDLPAMALLYYVPHTKETGEAILQAAAREGLNWTMYSLLSGYDFNQEELKPLIERALGALNPGEWEIGAALAAYNCYDNAFTAPLIAIASGSNNPINARAEAVRALACNRTDAGLKALKTLLNDPDPRIGASLVEALQAGCSPVKTQPGKHLRPGDFEAAEVRPIMERLLASPANGQEGLNAMEGVNLARMFPDDTLTPKLVALAKNPGFTYRVYAICALALNRTDEGVQTLKMLLNDPEQRISDLTEDAIRYAYTARGEEKGRPLRPDDFDAKFQQPEAPPAK